MGFDLVKVVVGETMEGGWARHVFYDTHQGGLIAFWDIHDERRVAGLRPVDQHAASACRRGRTTSRSTRRRSTTSPTMRQRWLDHGETSSRSTTAGARRSTPTTRTGSWSSSARTTVAFTDADRAEAAALLAAEQPELEDAARASPSTSPTSTPPDPTSLLRHQRAVRGRRRQNGVGQAITPSARSSASSRSVSPTTVAQHRVGVLAERGADGAHRARRARELRHDARHRHRPVEAGGEPQHHVARRELRSSAARSGAAWISPHGTECRSSTASRSSAGMLRGPAPRSRRRARPGARRAPRARRTAGRSRARAAPSPSHSRANTASAFAAITTSCPSAVGYAFDGATPLSTPPLRVADHAAELEVGDGRLHQREHRFGDRDVDLLARARCGAARAARSSVPITANSAASESPSEMPARAGGRSGSPVVKRTPPIASPIAPKPGSCARGPVWPKPGDVHEHDRRVRRGERVVVRCPTARACRA